MRPSTRLALVALCALPPALPAADPARSGRQRFSADAVALFAELTQGYDLDGRRFPGGKLDPAVLARLTRSSEKEVAAVATQAPYLKLLHELNRAQNRRVLEVFGDQAKAWPGIMAGHVIKAVVSSDTDTKDIRWAAKLLEDLMGTDNDRTGRESPQQAVNRAWSVACLGNGLGISMRSTMRSLAARGGSGSIAGKDAVAVTLETGRALGAITLTNRSGRALHHCLIFTRLESDRERIEAAARQEDLFGAFVLPAMGLSPKLVAGSREAARLRHHFNKQDKGVMVWVPEVPAGGKVTTLLAQPGYYSVSKSASMSIWCDELAIDPQPASNWNEVRPPQGKVTSRPGPGRVGTEVWRARWSAPYPGTGDLFYKGAIWRGTEVQPGGRAQAIDIEILQRTGDSYRADMRWSGRHARYIEGTVRDGVLTWRGAKGEYRPGVPHSGKITGKTVEGEYFLTLRGGQERLTFRLEYVPAKAD
jgi:hypothetical protein